MDYSQFYRIYANIPDKIRNEIIAVIDGKPYTWNASFIEINNDTALGRKIFKNLTEMDII